MKSIKLRLICLILLFVTVSKVFSQNSNFKIVYQSIAWSPQRNSIAFTAIKVKSDWLDYSPDKWKFYTYDIENKQLIEMFFSSTYFSFSPNEKTLAYDKNISGNKDIFLRDLQSGNETILVSNQVKDAGPTWSPNGDSIVFYSNRSGHEELYVISVDNREINQITNRETHKSYNPVWSPNSNLIVYYLEKDDSKDQVWLTDSNGSFHKNLTNDDHHNIYPSWTQDGRIIYVRDKGEAMIMNTNGTNKQRLIDGKVGLVRMDKTGKKLLLTKGDGNLYVYFTTEMKLEKVFDGELLMDK